MNGIDREISGLTDGGTVLYRIFDSHTHVYPEALAEKAAAGLGAFYHFQVAGKGTYDALEAEASESGTCGFLLFCVATNAHQVVHVNDSVAQLAARSRKNGFETIAFAGMHQDFADFEGELARCRAMGLTGVKLHPDIQGINADDPKLLPLYALMQETGMTLYLHVGDDRAEYRFSSSERTAHVARLFPGLKIVAAHLGGYRSWDRSYRLFGLDNVFFDCSSTLAELPADRAVRLMEQCGFDRILYGTDYPVMHLCDYLSLFLSLPLTETQREDILYRNAKRLLGF